MGFVQWKKSSTSLILAGLVAVTLANFAAPAADAAGPDCVPVQVEKEIQKAESASTSAPSVEPDAIDAAIIVEQQAELSVQKGMMARYAEKFKESKFSKFIKRNWNSFGAWWTESSFGKAQRRLAESRVGKGTGKAVGGIRTGGTWLATWFKLNSTITHFTREPGSFWAVTGRGLSEGLSTVFNLLNPIPYRPKWVKQPLDPIFEKLFKNAKYEPTAKEHALLEKYDSVKEFNKRKDFMLNNPAAHKFKRNVVNFKNMTRLLMVGMVILEGELTAGNKATVKDFLSNARWKLGPNQVQLIDEGMIPHLALRIGNRVYSYGAKELTVSSLETYLGQSESERRPTDVISTLNWAARSNRSVQIVTLNLSELEVKRLKADLDSEANRQYRHMTYANDFATMAARTLRRDTSVQIPPAIDASPGIIMSYFAMLKAQGNPLVEEFIHVRFKDSGSPLTRYLYSVSQESRVFFTTMEWNWITHVWLNLRTSNDDSKKYDLADLEVFRIVEKKAKEDLFEDPEFVLLQDEVSDIVQNDPKNVERRDELALIIEAARVAKIHELESGLDDAAASHDTAVYLSALREQVQIEYGRLKRTLSFVK